MKKHFLKILCILLSCVLLLSLAACGEEKENGGSSHRGTGGTSESIVSNATEEPWTPLSVLPGSTVGADYENMAMVLPDGTVMHYDVNHHILSLLEGWNDMVAIDVATGRCIIGLRKDGTVKAAKIEISKNQEYIQEIKEVEAWTDIVYVCATGTVFAGVKSDGTVVTTPLTKGYTTTWPENHSISQWTDIVKVCGTTVTEDRQLLIGLKKDGTVVMAGSEKFIESTHDQARRWTNLVDISVDGFMLIGLKADGTVLLSQNSKNNFDVSDWTDIVAVSATVTHVIGLKSDGTVVCEGKNDDGQCDTSAWADIVAINGGYDDTIGLRSDGTIIVAGSEYLGELEWPSAKLPE